MGSSSYAADSKADLTTITATTTKTKTKSRTKELGRVETSLCHYLCFTDFNKEEDVLKKSVSCCKCCCCCCCSSSLDLGSSQKKISSCNSSYDNEPRKSMPSSSLSSSSNCTIL